MAITTPQITLYTAHHCPFAHRVQIALRELNLPFRTTLIDITQPRTKDYLAINPSGQVPALDYNGRVLTESALIVQFLADTRPFGKPALQRTESDVVEAAMKRYEIGRFVEAFMRTHALFDAVVFALGGREVKSVKAGTYLEAVVKNVEPLLGDAAPFVGGERSLTMAEVSRGPVLDLL
jgi:glutathione S-transferase